MSAIILEPRCTVLDLELAVETLIGSKMGWRILKPSIAGFKAFLFSSYIAGDTCLFYSVVY